MSNGRYGEYGGQYISETLMNELLYLEEQYNHYMNDPEFVNELNTLLSEYAGRPSLLYYAKRMTEDLGGAKIYLKREDLNHTGAHKINNVLGQVLLAKKMGKTRVIAETGAGQHGVATATAAALLDMECEVFMGEVDTKRQALNVYRMELLGAKVHSVKSGTKTLKDAAQRLWQDMCAPTCDGNWIPVDVDQAYRDKAASGIEFIIGIPADETGVLRSFLGRKKFDDFVSSGMTVIRQYADDSLAGEIREFMETQKKLSGESEARAKLIEQWLAIREYRSAARLSEGGNKVRLLYWNEKALIEKLGTGTVDAAASLLGNEDALQMYGSVIHQDLAEILQKLLEKFVNGDTLQLYPNEIVGVDAIDWKAFPRALVVSDDRLYCETIEDRLTEVKGLLDFMVR